MLCGSIYRILGNNSSAFHFLNRQLESFYYKSMSVNIANDIKQDVDNVQKNNKRHIVDENNEVLVKVQKTDETQRVKRKNYALMLGYLGKNYYGMQRNPGMNTIEEELLTALLKADAITDEHFGNIKIINFQRAARTDKGVSAIRQIVNLKLPEGVKVPELNQFLPDDIRVFALKKVTKGFNCKNQCNARTYRYVIPTHAFVPENEESLKTTEEENDEVYLERRMKELSIINGKPYTEFRISPEMLDRVNAIAKSMEGTHNFHNYTSKVKPLDPRANRFIMQFCCTQTFVTNDMEFAILEVKGQSFMLHQIRKMVAVLIGVARNNATDDIINESFKMNKLNFPIAPSLGLSLNYVHYDHYNKRYGTDGIHEILEWTDWEDEVQKFDKENIMKHVVDTEISEKTMLTWVASLRPHRFPHEEDVAL